MNQKENPFFNLLFNIIIPVVVLNYGEKIFPQSGAVFFLLLALSFPVAYGVRDYVINKSKNFFSIFGIINVLLSGGFALFQLEGIWFAVKEAAFPLIFALWFLFSCYTSTPLMKWVINKSHIFRIDLIHSKLDQPEKMKSYEKILRKSTLYLSYCFFFSSILNFILALKIFVPLNETQVSSTSIINEQIADMTWISFIVIGLPLSIVSGWTLWWFISQLKKLTGLTMEEILLIDNQQKLKKEKDPFSSKLKE